MNKSEEKLPEIFEKIGEEVKKLNLNDHEPYQKYVKKTFSEMISADAENGTVPIFGISVCSCGCGNPLIFENTDVLTPEKTIKMLETLTTKLKNEFKNAN